MTLDRIYSAVSHALPEVVARKRVVQIVRDLAERNIDQEESRQQEECKQMLKDKNEFITEFKKKPTLFIAGSENELE